MLRKFLIRLGLVVATWSVTAGAAPALDKLLREGRIQEGLAAYASPKKEGERFSLAVLQALDGLQQFSANSGKLGLNPEFTRGMLPFFRVMMPGSGPVETNQDVATPEKVAALFNNLRDSLWRANRTLDGMGESEFKVEVNLSQARLDFDGDGVVSSNELLLAKLGPVLGVPQRTQADADIIVHFDSADAMWLKGYTHFLVGVIDIVMAYNWHPVWNQCAHVIFQHPEPEPPIARFTRVVVGQDFGKWADLIAALHEMRLELDDKKGVADARMQFMAMTACSRICWARVQAETDDDHEWLPSPRQTGPGGTKVTQAQIDGWMHVLDELDAILAGKKLLPHWRIKSGTGINVAKLAASPPRFDLVLLIQGSAVLPYLQEGPVSDQATWRQLMQPFGPGFARFAIWSQ